MAVSKRLRFEILRRDNHTCRYCGRSAPDVPLTVDHVIPITLGGSDDPTNLATACSDCNTGKSSVPPGSPLADQVAADADRFAAAIREVAQRRRADEIEVKKWFSKLWRLASDGLINVYDKDGKLLHRACSIRAYTDPWDFDPEIWTIDFPPRPKNWPSSIQNFIAAGLDRQDLESLVATAMGSRVRREDKWAYFCGCCWRHIRQLQDAAREVMAQEVMA